MKVFTCTDHDNIWVASYLLDVSYNLTELDIGTPQAIILQSGDY